MPLTAARHTRIHDDLQGLIKGDVRCDEVTRQLFATDASILQSRPVCIVCPQNTDDVIAVVRYADEMGIPIYLRGAGTSLTGESLGEGIVLVFSRYMRRILHTGDEYVTVQPGLLRRTLNGITSRTQHRLFGPLAGNVSSASLGSILARNGAGLHYLRYGLPSDHVVSMSVVLANGDLLTLDRRSLAQPLQGRGSVALAQEIAYGKEYIVAGKVAHILDNRTSEQFVESSNRLPVDRAGYAEHAVLQRGKAVQSVDLARLFLGSEGTLGVTVEATLKTVSLPQRQCAAAFFFNSIFKAIEAVAIIMPLRPVLCELIDRRRLTMVREWDARYHPHIPTDAEAALLVELDAGTLETPMSADDCQDRLKHLMNLVTEEQLSDHVLRVNTDQDFQLFDQVIRRSELVLGRMRYSIQPIPLFDDIAMPLKAMDNVVRELLTLFQQHKMAASFSGHVGQGHLRIHPLLDIGQPDVMNTLHPLIDSVYSTISHHGGTISSEWGTGLLKSQFLPQQLPYLFPLFREIKETFDPHYLLNSGKVIPLGTYWTKFIRHGLKNRGHASPSPFQSHDSFLATPKPQNEAPPSQLEIQLKWDQSHVFESSYQCNGCGECLRFDRQSRICPLFRGSAAIEYAPRSKADLLRGILEHDIDLEQLVGERAKEIADTCFHCRMCDIECPSKVDINVLAFRSKAAYVAAHGLSLNNLLISRLDSILKLLTPGYRVFNAAMRNKVVRWFFEKMFQIPQSRTFPALSRRPFLNRNRWFSRWHSPLPKQMDNANVALFVDTYANHFDPQLAEFAVQILEHNGFSVHVPVRQRSSGRSSFLVGHANRAEQLARYNTAQMSELIRQGYKIVTIEPHSASCLSKDYRYLVDSSDSELMEEHVMDFCSFLFQHHLVDKLRIDFRSLPYRVGYHAPCSGLATSSSLATDTMPTERLLHLIPDLEVQRIEQGCCGMGGLWGFQQKNYRHSLQIGTPLFRALRSPNIAFGVSDCCSCCLQMAQGSRKHAHHPIRLLAAGYGFFPAEVLEQ